MNHPHIVIIYYIKPSPRWIITNVSNYVLIIPDHHVIMIYALIIPDNHVIIIIYNIQQCTNPFILFCAQLGGVATQSSSVHFGFHPTSGWWYTYPSEKWWSSSVEMMKFPTEWENKKCSKPSTSVTIIFPLLLVYSLLTTINHHFSCSKPSTRLALCTCFQPEPWVLKYFPKRYLATTLSQLIPWIIFRPKNH